MLVPIYSVGEKITKNIKEKITRREYNISELNNIYKAILKVESNSKSNLGANAIVFLVFAFLSYQTLKSTGDVVLSLMMGIIFYSIIMLFFFWFSKVEKKQFLKLIKKYYTNDYNSIINTNIVDNTQFGGFIVSKNITRNGAKAKWIFRQASSISQCNGWNIYSEIDNQVYISDPNNFEIVSIETISKFVPELLKIYNLPYGTELTLMYNNGVFTGFVDNKTGNYVSLN